MSYNVSYFLVDKYFRLYYRIKSRISVLCKYFEYINDHNEITNSILNHYYSDIDVLNSYINLLDINNLNCNKDIIYKDIYKKFKLFPITNKLHILKLFGLYTKANYDNEYNLRMLQKQKLSLEKIILCRPSNRLRESIKKIDIEINSEQYKLNFIKFSLEQARKKAIKSRKNHMLVRLSNEVHLRKNENWFFLFNTLTIRTEDYDKVFDQNSTVWTDYIRLVDRSIGISIFGNWRNAISYRRLGNEFHSYFAVVERGGITGRLHIHVLHMMKKLPYSCVDPNAGLTYSYNRCIDQFRKYWKYGHSSPVAVRFDSNDAYAKLFWRWPVIKTENGYDPLPFKQPGALINYLGKYLTKSYERNTKKDGLSWRVKLSRNLGMKILNEVVSKMSNVQLIHLMKMKGTRIFKIKDRTIPSLMIIKLAVKNYLKRRLNYVKNKSNSTNSLTNLSLWAFLKFLTPLPNLLQQLKNSILNLNQFNLQNSIVISTRNLSLLAVSNLKKIFDNYIEIHYKSDISSIGLKGSLNEVLC